MTNEQIKAIKEIKVANRYEAMEQVAKILNAKTTQKATWASNRKVILIDKETWAEITVSKGKIKYIEFYSKIKEIGMVSVKIQ